MSWKRISSKKGLEKALSSEAYQGAHLVPQRSTMAFNTTHLSVGYTSKVHQTGELEQKLLGETPQYFGTILWDRPSCRATGGLHARPPTFTTMLQFTPAQVVKVWIQ